MFRGVKRSACFSVLIAAILLSVVPSRAAGVAVHRSGSAHFDLVGLGSAAEILPRCTLTEDWEFNGWRRANNTVYGTFTFYSDIGCNKKMVYLSSVSNMRKAPNTPYYGGGPAKCGVDHAAATGTCYYTRMNGSAYCDPCNGAWTMDATWKLRWPALFSYLPYGSTNPAIVCTRNLSGKTTCTGHGLRAGTVS